jgi:hypothetical protein
MAELLVVQQVYICDINGELMFYQLGQNHPSSNTYLSLNNFQYFPQSLTKLSDFLSLDVQIKGLQMLFGIRNKGATQKT